MAPTAEPADARAGGARRDPRIDRHADRPAKCRRPRLRVRRAGPARRCRGARCRGAGRALRKRVDRNSGGAGPARDGARVTMVGDRRVDRGEHRGRARRRATRLDGVRRVRRGSVAPGIGAAPVEFSISGGRAWYRPGADALCRPARAVPCGRPAGNRLSGPARRRIAFGRQPDSLPMDRRDRRAGAHRPHDPVAHGAAITGDGLVQRSATCRIVVTREQRPGCAGPRSAGRGAAVDRPGAGTARRRDSGGIVAAQPAGRARALELATGHYLCRREPCRHRCLASLAGARSPGGAASCRPAAFAGAAGC